MATAQTTDATPPQASTFEPFRHRDFTLYQVARVFLILGGQMVILGLQLQVWNLTKSNLQVGGVGFAQFLPNVVFSILAGHVADRRDRRMIVMICALACAAAAGLLAWESHRAAPRLTIIYLACSLFGFIRAFSAPAGHAFLPALVPGSLLKSAIGWHLTIFQLGTVVGPLFGGLVYGRNHAMEVYLGGAGLYVAAFVGMAFLRARPRPNPNPEPFERAVSAGIRHVWKDKRLLGAMSLDLFAVLLGGATALLPAFTEHILHRGPEVTGLLRSAPAVGAGLMALFIAFRPLQRRIGFWILGGVLVFGLSTIGLGFARSVGMAYVLIMVGGAADMVSVNVRHTLIQVATPDAMRGRVSAVSMIFINTSNELGESESGLTAHWWGTAPAIIVGGIGTLAVVFLWTALFPDLRKADKFDAPAAAPEPEPPDSSEPSRVS